MTRLEILKAEKEQIKDLRCLSFSLMDKCTEWYDREIEAIEVHGASNEVYKDEAQADGDLKIISTEILLKDVEREKLRQELLKQKEDGLIVLPWYCKVAIPSAEPYKGMTNKEVIMKLFPNPNKIDGYFSFTEEWANAPYEPQERSE